MTRMNQAEPFADISTLSDPVRRSLYAYVVRQTHDVSRDEAAEVAGISRALAAFHLDRLVRDGLLKASFRRLSGKTGPGAGRPAKLYSKSGRSVEMSIPPRNYQLAARLLASSVTSKEAKSARRSAHAYGTSLGAEARERAGARPSRKKLVESLVAVLTENGFEPVSGNGAIRLRNCPFDALAQDYRDLVCGMNHEMQRGVIEGLEIEGIDASLEPQPGYCCVSFRIAPR
jgi:predicted ArsR family transcriptional regulator